MVDIDKNQDVIKEIEDFKSDKLKTVETEEKVQLPTAADIAQEKVMQQIVDPSSIKLKPAETVEKMVLPTAEDIKAEKESA